MPDRTEREKMLSGERYNCLAPGLEADRRKVKTILRDFNQITDIQEREYALKTLLGKVGKGSQIESPFHCVYGQNIYIGDQVYINVHCAILDCNEVRIGNHVMIGPYVQIYTAAHDLRAEERIQGWEVAKPISIGENVWIGGSAILLPGINIGQNSVVGAGAVVTRDVPANVVTAGNPARVIREL